MENKPTIEEEIVKMLRTVYDPEIPVNIYDLGLIYNIEVNDGTVKIEMTFAKKFGNLMYLTTLIKLLYVDLDIF